MIPEAVNVTTCGGPTQINFEKTSHSPLSMIKLFTR